MKTLIDENIQNEEEEEEEEGEEEEKECRQWGGKAISWQSWA